MIILITLLTTFAIANHNPPPPAAACADFSGVFKAVDEPNVPMLTLAQRNCDTINFAFDDKNLLFYLDGRSRMLKNDTLLKIVQSGRINRRYMMIYLTVSIFSLQGVTNKEGVILFEKGGPNEIWITFKGDVPDKVKPEYRYHLIRQRPTQWPEWWD